MLAEASDAIANDVNPDQQQQENASDGGGGGGENNLNGGDANNTLNNNPDHNNNADGIISQTTANEGVIVGSGGESGHADEAAATGSVTSNEDLFDSHEQKYLEQREKRRLSIRNQLLDQSKVAPLYYSCSEKENLVLSYVHNFNRQYTQLFPGRKELLLCPPNEFGIKVHISKKRGGGILFRISLKYFIVSTLRNLCVLLFGLRSYHTRNYMITGDALDLWQTI